MKKSNKISVFYILSSVLLFVLLVFGGGYGLYLSIGLNFVKSSMSNIAGTGGAENVSYGGMVNFKPSMTGVIILSVALIILSIFDLISLIRQIVFFKQFKMIKNSSIEKKIEKKVKSRGAVVVFAILIDLISIAFGIAGIFVNQRCFVGNNMAWVLYLIDALVAFFAVVSMILLIVKLKKSKKIRAGEDIEKNDVEVKPLDDKDEKPEKDVKNGTRLDEIEYALIKLKFLKSSKIITEKEYLDLREKITGIKPETRKNKQIKKKDNF